MSDEHEQGGSREPEASSASFQNEWAKKVPKKQRSSENGFSSELEDDGKLRAELRKILGSMPFDFFIGLLVVINFAILWFETDQRVKGMKSDEHGWTSLVQVSVAFFFVVEVLLKVFLMGRKFFASKLNTFDFLIVVLGGVMEILSMFSGVDAKGFTGLLRICRVARLFHIARLLKNTDEFWQLLSGLANASKTLFWASILMFGILSIFSLFAVETLQPLMDEIAASGMYSECPWCKDAFNSVMESNLTLFGCISGGDWPMLARPLIVAYPGTGFLFILVIFIMFFGMINLITAVIVDAAAAAREQDVEKKSRKRVDEQAKALQEMHILCTEMDADESGTISLRELINGYHMNPRFFALMQLMDIEPTQLECVFEVLDKERHGEVPHVEFTQQLWKMKSQEVKTSLMFVTHSLEQLQAQTDSVMSQTGATQQALDKLALATQDVLGELQELFSKGEEPRKLISKLSYPSFHSLDIPSVHDSHLTLQVDRSKEKASNGRKRNDVISCAANRNGLRDIHFL